MGKELGKAAGKTFNFLNCAFPGLSSIIGCVKDVIDSAKSCSGGGSNCHIAIGGQNSKCLHLSSSDAYHKTYGEIYHFGTFTNNTRLLWIKSIANAQFKNKSFSDFLVLS